MACQQLGFVAGVLVEEEDLGAVEFQTNLLPPWLSDWQCSGSEAAVSECARSEFGETGRCGDAQPLIVTCVSNSAHLPEPIRRYRALLPLYGGGPCSLHRLFSA